MGAQASRFPKIFYPMNVIKMAYAISLEGRKTIREIAPFMIRNDVLKDPSNEQDTGDNPEYYTEDEIHFVNHEAQPMDIDEINKQYNLSDAVKANIEILKTQERYAEFTRVREELMQRSNLEEYDWFEDLIPIAIKTLAEYAKAVLDDDENVANIIQMIHQWWFEANLDEFTSYLPNETTDYYWRRLRTCKKN